MITKKINKLYEKIYQLAYKFNPEKQYKRRKMQGEKVRVVDEETFRAIYLALKE